MIKKTLRLLAISAMSLMAIIPQAHAHDYYVNTTLDLNSGDLCTTAPNGCSLREAIISANSIYDDGGNDTNQPDVIHLTIAGTYFLDQPGANEDNAATGDLDIRDNVIIINESGGAVIIDGSGQDRVFDIFDDMTGNQAFATFEGLIIQHGVADNGGGIRGRNINLVDSTVQNNQALFNGGGIYGVATLIGSSIYANQAGVKGGGIYALDGVSSALNSTFSSNMADDPAVGAGGGIYNDQYSRFSLTQVTLNNNYALKGASLTNVGTMLSLENTIVANSPIVPSCFGSVNSLGHNLNSDNFCGFSAPGDLVNTPALLGPFQNNGGKTGTHNPLAMSPAINAGKDLSSITQKDQRGFSRIASFDIGAVEYQAPVSFTPDDEDRSEIYKYPLFDPTIWMGKKKNISINPGKTAKPLINLKKISTNQKSIKGNVSN